jgi:hypothetical protein
MTFDLTDDEKVALTGLLRRTIDEDRYPPSPPWAPLKAILAKLEPWVAATQRELLRRALSLEPLSRREAAMTMPPANHGYLHLVSALPLQPFVKVVHSRDGIDFAIIDGGL